MSQGKTELATHASCNRETLVNVPLISVTFGVRAGFHLSHGQCLLS